MRASVSFGSAGLLLAILAVFWFPYGFFLFPIAGLTASLLIHRGTQSRGQRLAASAISAMSFAVTGFTVRFSLISLQAVVQPGWRVRLGARLRFSWSSRRAFTLPTLAPRRSAFRQRPLCSIDCGDQLCSFGRNCGFSCVPVVPRMECRGPRCWRLASLPARRFPVRCWLAAEHSKGSMNGLSKSDFRRLRCSRVDSSGSD
jgi:hypothetical protein